MSDNMRVDVSAEGRADFNTAFHLLFDLARKGKAVAWNVIPGKGLVLYWVLPERAPVPAGVAALPFPMGPSAAVEFAWHWLEQADYGPQPDHDGDNTKGWRVYNEEWGHVADDYRAFMAVAPVWMMHGK